MTDLRNLAAGAASGFAVLLLSLLVDKEELVRAAALGLIVAALVLVALTLWDRRSAVRPQLRIAPDSFPRIPTIFHEENREGKTARAYHVAVLSLLNQPPKPSSAATARRVAPRIEVYRQNGDRVFDVVGQWTDPDKSISSSDVGPLSTVKVRDIAPGPAAARVPLLVDIRYPTDQGWFLFVAPQYVGTQAYRLPRDKYRLRLSISGENLRERDAEFFFALTPGVGGLPQIDRAKAL